MRPRTLTIRSLVPCPFVLAMPASYSAGASRHSSLSRDGSSQRRFLELAHARFREGASVARELGLVRVRVSEVSPPYVVTSDGRRLTNFASCCYLETATHPDVVGASLSATERFGTQFSISPTYMGVDLYSVLESKMAEIAGSPVVVAATTTLAHFGALPALVPADALVVVDRQAHNSLQMASRLLAGSGVEVCHIPHSDLSALADLVAANASRPVWYVADGVYSMFGDVAPYDELAELADRFENLWLYLDDAHGVGWSGVRGRGGAADAFAGHPRAVVVLGLAKSWGSGGAAVAVPSVEVAEEVLLSPTPFVFSGPLKPSELGAAVASADWHLSAEREVAAGRLAELVAHTFAEADRLGLEVMDRSPTPIFFVRVGETERAFELGARLLAEGFYVNVSGFPVVPRGKAGIRFTISTALTEELISDMLACLRRSLSSSRLAA